MTHEGRAAESGGLADRRRLHGIHEGGGLEGMEQEVHRPVSHRPLATREIRVVADDDGRDPGSGNAEFLEHRRGIQAGIEFVFGDDDVESVYGRGALELVDGDDDVAAIVHLRDERRRCVDPVLDDEDAQRLLGTALGDHAAPSAVRRFGIVTTARVPTCVSRTSSSQPPRAA